MNKLRINVFLLLLLLFKIGYAHAEIIYFQSAAYNIVSNERLIWEENHPDEAYSGFIFNRPIYLSEFSNADVTFQSASNEPYSYGNNDNYFHDWVNFTGQGSFTATFAKPVDTVIFNIIKKPFIARYEFGEITYDILNAIYKDSNGLVIGGKGVTVPYLDDNEFYSSISAPPPVFSSNTPISSITFEWIAGSTNVITASELRDRCTYPPRTDPICQGLNVTRVFGRGGDNVLAADSFEYTFANIATVPEPETYAMLLAGLGFIAFSKRRKKP